MNIKLVTTQFKRELWENKTGFFWGPLIIAILATVLASYALVSFESVVLSDNVNIHINGENYPKSETNETLTDQEAREKFVNEAKNNPDFLKHAMNVFLSASMTILSISFLVVLIAYAHSTLFDDRKAREVLFWRSLPVSETTNVLTKLLMIFIVAPTIILFLSLCSGSLVYLVGAAVAGEGAALQPAFAKLAMPFKTFGYGLIFLVLLFPVFAWMLFASAFAKKSPMLLSVLVPLGLLLLDKVARSLFHVNLYVKEVLVNYLEFLRRFYPSSHSSTDGLLDAQLIPPLLIVLAIGGLLIAASIWLRNHRYEL